MVEDEAVRRIGDIWSVIAIDIGEEAAEHSINIILLHDWEGNTGEYSV